MMMAGFDAIDCKRKQTRKVNRMNTETNETVTEIREIVEDDAENAQYARICKVLSVIGHPVRVRIFLMLTKGSRYVKQIWMDLKVSQAMVSQHLSVMKAAEILRSERNGNMVLYSVNMPDSLANLLVDILTR